MELPTPRALVAAATGHLATSSGDPSLPSPCTVQAPPCRSLRGPLTTPSGLSEPPLGGPFLYKALRVRPCPPARCTSQCSPSSHCGSTASRSTHPLRFGVLGAPRCARRAIRTSRPHWWTPVPEVPLGRPETRGSAEQKGRRPPSSGEPGRQERKRHPVQGTRVRDTCANATVPSQLEKGSPQAASGKQDSERNVERSSIQRRLRGALCMPLRLAHLHGAHVKDGRAWAWGWEGVRGRPGLQSLLGETAATSSLHHWTFGGGEGHPCPAERGHRERTALSSWSPGPLLPAPADQRPAPLRPAAQAKGSV